MSIDSRTSWWLFGVRDIRLSFSWAVIPYYYSAASYTCSIPFLICLLIATSPSLLYFRLLYVNCHIVYSLIKLSAGNTSLLYYNTRSMIFCTGDSIILIAKPVRSAKSWCIIALMICYSYSPNVEPVQVSSFWQTLLLFMPMATRASIRLWWFRWDTALP